MLDKYFDQITPEDLTNLWGSGQRNQNGHETVSQYELLNHAIGVVKRVFGFAKLRYRGLNKNRHRLLVTCALANLFMARRHLLRCQPA